MFVLILARQDHVAFRTNNALDIKLNFEEIQDVGLRSVDLSAQGFKVLEGSTGGNESSEGHLFLGLLELGLILDVHELLNSVE